MEPGTKDAAAPDTSDTSEIRTPDGEPSTEKEALDEVLDEGLDEGLDKGLDKGLDEGLGTHSELEELGFCRRRIKASVPSDSVRELLDNNYRELATTVELPGFRRGRVPRRLLEKRFGEEINSDVKQSLLKDSFAEVVKEQELKVFGAPRFDNVQFGAETDFTYEAEIEVQPEFQLPKYKSLKIEQPESSLDESQVDEELTLLRRQQGHLSTIDTSAAGADDYFFGRYELSIDGDRVKTQIDVSFCPNTNRIDVFSVDDLKEKFEAWDRTDKPLSVPVTVPDSYPDEILRGKDAELEFFLKEAKTVELPPLDDAFAQALGRETLEEAREEIRRSLEAREKRRAQKEVEKRIIDKLVEETDIELPDEFIERHQERAKTVREQQQLGDESSGEAPKTEEKEEESAEKLRREFKEFFLLERIGDKEKIFATEDEVKERIRLMAAVYGMSEKDLTEELRSSGRLEEVRFSVRNEKVKAFLRKKTRVLESGGSGGKSTEEDEEASPAGTQEPADEADQE